jgi:hypothetical protein
MSKKTVAALALITFSGAALAVAPAFTEADADNNGTISFQEATVVEGLDFQAADTNGDGALDQAEYDAATSE